MASGRGETRPASLSVVSVLIVSDTYPLRERERVKTSASDELPGHPDLCRIPDCIEHSSRALGNHLPSSSRTPANDLTECDYRPCDDLCRRGHVFCRRHKCEIGSCLRLKAGLAAHDSREPTTAVSARFCTQHECDVPRCSNQAAGNRTYCGDHTCREGGCERQTRPGSAYCDFCGRDSPSGGWEDVYYSPALAGWPVRPPFRRC